MSYTLSRRNTMWGDIETVVNLDSTDVTEIVNQVNEEGNNSLTFDTPVDFRYIAHRGSSRRGFEGTLKLYLLALEEGVVELGADLRLSSDNIIYISHDANVQLHGIAPSAIKDNLSKTLDEENVDWDNSNGTALSRRFAGCPSDQGSTYCRLDTLFKATKHRRCIYWLETKVFTLLPYLADLVRVMGINPRRINYQDAVADYPERLLLAKRIGFTTSVQYSATSSTVTAAANIVEANTLEADFIVTSFSNSAPVHALYVASGIEIILYESSTDLCTRYERDQCIALGVHGLTSDDVAYVMNTTATATVDSFHEQRWMQGMRANYDEIHEARGTFIQNVLGGSDPFYQYWIQHQETNITEYTRMGWACPIGSNTFEITFSVVHLDGSPSDNYVGIAVNDASWYDRQVENSNTLSNDAELAYLFIQRHDGELQIYKRVGKTVTLLVGLNLPTKLTDVWYHYRAVITATEVEFQMLDTAEGVKDPAKTVTVANTEIRGQYFGVLCKETEAQFFNIRVTKT